MTVKSKKNTESKNKGGRPKITFTEDDWKKIKNMCSIMCTAQEIADVMSVSVDTLGRRIKSETGVSFAEYFKKHSAGGKITLRRNLFVLSEKNAGVAIFLSKNYLGMRDEPLTNDSESQIKTLCDAVKNV